MVRHVELGESSICLGHRRVASPFRRVASPFRLGHFCPRRVDPGFGILAPGDDRPELTALGKVKLLQPGGDIDPRMPPLETRVTCHSFDP
jgi:hypothetical protein